MNISWKDILHYGISALLVLDGAAAYFHMLPPDVTVSDPVNTMGVGAAVFVAGLKGGWMSGK